MWSEAFDWDFFIGTDSRCDLRPEDQGTNYRLGQVRKAQHNTKGVRMRRGYASASVVLPAVRNRAEKRREESKGLLRRHHHTLKHRGRCFAGKMQRKEGSIDGDSVVQTEFHAGFHAAAVGCLGTLAQLKMSVCRCHPHKMG